MNEHERKVVEQMKRRGGGFVVALAECFIHADSINYARLRNAFPDYWKQYEKYVK